MMVHVQRSSAYVSSLAAGDTVSPHFNLDPYNVDVWDAPFDAMNRPNVVVFQGPHLADGACQILATMSTTQTVTALNNLCTQVKYRSADYPYFNLFGSYSDNAYQALFSGFGALGWSRTNVVILESADVVAIRADVSGAAAIVDGTFDINYVFHEACSSYKIGTDCDYSNVVDAIRMFGPIIYLQTVSIELLLGQDNGFLATDLQLVLNSAFASYELVKNLPRTNEELTSTMMLTTVGAAWNVTAASAFWNELAYIRADDAN